MTKNNTKKVPLHTLGDPYKMGYQAGLSGKGHNSNPYPKAILSTKFHSEGVSCYHRWFCGWNDGLDKAESVKR